MTATHEDVWDRDAAQSHDTPGTGMFAPDVLDPVVDRLAALAGSGGALELAIGMGRIAVPLRARGTAVSGIELAALVDQLRTKAGESSIPVTVGNMVEAEMPGDYVLAFLVFNGMSNLLTQAEQVSYFRNAARHLRPGGRFVIELWVPELPRLAPAAQAIVGPQRPGYMMIDTCDVVDQHVVSHHPEFGDGKEARLFRSPYRDFWSAELDLRGQIAGFDLESRHADWSGTPFTAAARSHVSVYWLPG